MVPLYRLLEKMIPESVELAKVQRLASFYLQTAFSLYQNAEELLQWAAADAFHSRGNYYALRTIFISWLTSLLPLLFTGYIVLLA